MKNKNENIESLFDSFFDETSSKKSVDDITAGDNLFKDNPAPEPDDKLIAQIKNEVQQKLSENHKQRTTIHYIRILSAAAAVIVISLVLLNIPSGNPNSGGGTLVFNEKDIEWETEEFTQNEIEFALIAAQVEELEEEIVTMNLADNGWDSDDIEELEIELMEINSDFWKG